MSIFIGDGYDLTKSISGRTGVYPKLEIKYRPALDRKVMEYWSQVDTSKGHDAPNDPARLDAWLTDLIASNVASINGESLDKAKAAKLLPEIRTILRMLVLSQADADAPCDVGAEAKN